MSPISLVLLVLSTTFLILRASSESDQFEFSFNNSTDSNTNTTEVEESGHNSTIFTSTTVPKVHSTTPTVPTDVTTTTESLTEATDHNDTEIDQTTESDLTTREDKYTSYPQYIILEHIDFVTLRLRHIMNQTTTNLTELIILQQEEFLVNEVYKKGWERARRIFNESTRPQLAEKNYTEILKLPEEFHIALISYTSQYPYPALYTDFNKHTRELCSGKDIEEYHYKSYFKLVEMATEALGREMKTPEKTRFLYRGVSTSFALKEGQQLAFQHFISTSLSLPVAEAFSGGTTLFEFHMDIETTSTLNTLGVYLGSHSEFQGEEEVLLSPLQIFYVDSIHRGQYYTRYVLLSKPLTLTDKDDCLLLRDELSKDNLDEKSYKRLKVAVSVLGALLIVAVGAGALVLFKKERDWCHGKKRTESALQLT